MRNTATPAWYLSLAVFTSMILSACSISQMASHAFADALSESGDTYAVDNDLEFVGEATPFALKTMEGLLEMQPDHQGLLLTTCRGFTQYAWVYVEQPANEIEEEDVQAAYALRERALNLYVRARDYGLQGLVSAHPQIEYKLSESPVEALKVTTADDVPLMYWTAAAWASAISLGKDRTDLVADLSIVEALIYRAYELNESYGQGVIHTFLISYEMSKKGYSSESLAAAQKHFDRAMELSSIPQAAPYVTWAESVSIPGQSKQEFISMLNKALEIDSKEKNNQRLANLVMQKRARFLLDHIEYYFLD